ncbi:MAG: NADH-quinone oxidoreductase subunit L [Chloroflexi bacterium RBG_13_51_18]|nr:MAG: NADH-quinone oxidoreductase subunit L [Chloroflexi bacterium RBG_13_51_18]
MIPYQLVWLIMLLPLFAFIINGLLIRPFVNRKSKLYGYITIASIATSAVFSVWALISVMSAENHTIAVPDVNWIVIGSFNFHVGIIMDQLSAVMVVVVSIVSLMVQIYSLGYMAHDEAGYYRYYTFMSLFTFSMLGLVLADNLLFTFVFWEMVGLCSYLLIGFWFHKPSAANAAKKAFIVTRIGDFGFLAGILILYFNAQTFDIQALHNMAVSGLIGGTALMWAAIGLFGGAIGKSAQFPLHVWLPDAMEGPTPVSALIHSATMVCAGVFLVARTMPLFVFSPEAIRVVAVIGGFTAIFAATMGLVANDIKRVLAYSTISQIGYMMLGLGAVGTALAAQIQSRTLILPNEEMIIIAKAAVAVGMFHLFTHAFFKALLFMGAGSVNHATGTFDMRQMGGLRKTMPWTYATFLIGSLSLAGIWPLAGFWSKDEILASAFTSQPALFWLALITVFLTAFYMFRAIFMTFHGDYQGGAKEEGHDYTHTHESPWVMVAPLVFLALLAIGAGWWNVSGGFSSFMGHEAEAANGGIAALFTVFTHTVNGVPLPLISLLVALLGIFSAYAVYLKRWITKESIGKAFGPLYQMAADKYYFDELYENIIVKLGLVKGLFNGFQLFDSKGVDGMVNGAADIVVRGGKAIRQAQTGQLQLYGLFIGIGVAIIAICVLLFGS